ncbi:uncharacterized protein LOC107046479 [Diachasma alloeum]|uniref:uncharacterized protein LOC107046479 n=1 Tax=Diachasma alloeum TaxID=454923 RepID=UPI00073838FE|nr:uncharacterized protein LOC107046479 [Diachasma alloeum]
MASTPPYNIDDDDDDWLGERKSILINKYCHLEVKLTIDAPSSCHCQLLIRSGITSTVAHLSFRHPRCWPLKDLLLEDCFKYLETHEPRYENFPGDRSTYKVDILVGSKYVDLPPSMAELPEPIYTQLDCSSNVPKDINLNYEAELLLMSGNPDPDPDFREAHNFHTESFFPIARSTTAFNNIMEIHREKSPDSFQVELVWREAVINISQQSNMAFNLI